MLPSLDVENVYIYIADAVRWDFAPDDIVNEGRTIKTVASSIHSPTSISSIVSGTLLPQHGVGTFKQSLPAEVPNAFHDLPLNTAFANTINDVRFDSGESESIIANTLNVETSAPERLVDIDTPFLFVERGPGGHAPYGRKQERTDATEYFESRPDATRDLFAREYAESVAEDAEWFRNRLAELDSRGVLDDTLVIYTSDHGELLGESGMVAHSPPIHPRHVYVPTTFIHPDLEGSFQQDSVLRHVDLLPTVAALLNVEVDAPIKPAGRDLTEQALARRGPCYYSAARETRVGTVNVQYDSVWDATGGCVICQTSLLSRILLGLHQSMRTPWRHYIRSHLEEYVPSLLRGDRCYWAPELSRQEAAEWLDRVQVESIDRTQSRREDVAEDRLRELGYIE